MDGLGLGNGVLSKSLIAIHGKQVFSGFAPAFAGAQHLMVRVASGAPEWSESVLLTQ
jgi:hypothetical protein